MRRFIDVPDRLPYEVLERVSGGFPRIDVEHHLGPVDLVMATKGSGTVRPFVRISPVDLLLYQALVDALAPDLEGGLGSRNEVFAYRQDTTGDENPFLGTPTWTDFITSVRQVLTARPLQYALTADVTNFFIYVDVDELERRLLEVSAQPVVVRDLGELLRSWQHLGVRGLPQGVPPSSPLGNFYLSHVDAALRDGELTFRRYMDDLWVFTRSYSEARRVQDQIERLLYEDRLGLGSEKSRIRRTETAMRDTQTAEQMIQLRREELREELVAAVDPYVGEVDIEYEEEEIDEAAVHAEYDDLMATLQTGEYPEQARPRFIAVYRQLEKARDAYAFNDVPQVLERMPDLTPAAARYVARAPSDTADDARAVLLAVMSTERFHRDQEWLHLCRGGLWFPHRPSPSLAARFAEVARTHPHPLVRARALLAWGAQSDPEDFSLADEVWPTAAPEWRAYVLLSIQGKATTERDERYDRWSGEERFLRQVADQVRDNRFPWRSL